MPQKSVRKIATGSKIRLREIGNVTVSSLVDLNDSWREGHVFTKMFVWDSDRNNRQEKLKESRSTLFGLNFLGTI